MRFSVIVPVYAAQAYLHRCIQSVLDQTLEDFQLVLVDDGSKDDCGAICDAFAAGDDRILVIHQENSGVSAARNRGLACAVGEYVIFLDADDCLPPQFLENAQHILRNYPQADYIQFGWKSWNEGQPVPQPVPMTNQPVHHDKADALRAFLEYRIFNQEPWGKVVSRRLANTAAFPEDITIGEDLAVVYRWLDAAKCVISTDATGYYYCLRASGAMGSRKYRGVEDAARVYEQMWRHFMAAQPQLRAVSSGRYASDLMQLMRDLRKMALNPQREKVYRMLCEQLREVPAEQLHRITTRILRQLVLHAPGLYFFIYDLRDRQ